MLRQREAAGRPVTVGLIGAGKFGTMFLTQVRRTHGMHLVGLADLDVERARRQLERGRLERRKSFAAPSLADAVESRATHVTARRGSADRLSGDRGDHRGDRRAGGRHPPRARGDQPRQAHRHGQCGGGRGGRPAPGAQGAGRRRRLQPRLGRPAGADLRACRLGAHLRLHRGRRRQGHALRAVLSPVHARHAVGDPRPLPEDRRPRVDQSENVQQLHRRHQVRRSR